MPRIAWFGFPLRSHTVPSLPVVAALVRAGAAVTFHTTAAHGAMVEATGATVRAEPLLEDRIPAEADLRTLVRTLAAIRAEIVPALLAGGAAPELVIADASAPWGRDVAAAHGCPCASSVTTFVFTRSMLRLIGANAWMSDADIDLLATSGDLKLIYSSARFQPGGAFLDDSHLFVGPLLEGRRRDGVRLLPEGARPLAYVSLGTIYNADVGLLERIAAQLAQAGWQVIVSLGSEAGHPFRAPSPHVRVVPFVDQLAVLEHASLVVSHGGLQTVTEALAHGVPLIVLPQDVDQHLVARRAAGLGAAVVLETTPVSADAFAAALARFEAERPRLAQGAAAIGQSFTAVMPLEAAVQRLLDLPATAGRCS